MAKTPPKSYVKHRENTSTIVMYPWEVARELLLPESSIYKEMAIGVERGGLRAICLGDPSSGRPRRVVHRQDFDLWVEYKRGLITLAEYAKRAGGSK